MNLKIKKNLLYYPMPSLRGHHLICLHFFNGEGYSPEFIVNLQNTLRAAAVRKIDICFGADDICRGCPYLENKSCRYSETSDQEVKDMDMKALTLLKLSTGCQAAWDDIKKALPQIFPEWFLSYCNNCEWRRVCERDAGFRLLAKDFESPPS